MISVTHTTVRGPNESDKGVRWSWARTSEGMGKTMRVPTAVLGIVLATVVAASAQPPGQTGVLLLAHGGAAQWNERVGAVAKAVDGTQPTEVAFGMASRGSIQAAVDKLTARGVTSIVAVPLFVSSHSSVITSTEYLLGLRCGSAGRPEDLREDEPCAARRAGRGGDEHAAHAPAVDPASPVTTTVPVRIDAGVQSPPADCADRRRPRPVRSAPSPANEAVILVAHGPVPEDDNRRWLADMAVLADQVACAGPVCLGRLPDRPRRCRSGHAGGGDEGPAQPRREAGRRWPRAC